MAGSRPPLGLVKGRWGIGTRLKRCCEVLTGGQGQVPSRISRTCFGNGCPGQLLGCLCEGVLDYYMAVADQAVERVCIKL